MYGRAMPRQPLPVSASFSARNAGPRLDTSPEVTRLGSLVASVRSVETCLPF